MKIKLILISSILIIILSVFLIFYPLKFDFYDQSKAKRLVDIFIIPLFLIAFGSYVIKIVRRGEIDWKKFSKEILFAIILFGVFYIFMIRSVLSCGILFINCYPKEKEIVEIDGKIIDIVKYEGHGKVLGKYKISINQNGEEFHFECNKHAIEKYSLNENFKTNMKIGSLNIMYK